MGPQPPRPPRPPKKPIQEPQTGASGPPQTFEGGQRNNRRYHSTINNKSRAFSTKSSEDGKHKYRKPRPSAKVAPRPNETYFYNETKITYGINFGK
jgi:hypothetical protein